MQEKGDGERLWTAVLTAAVVVTGSMNEAYSAFLADDIRADGPRR